jgi:hypothetical protein
MSDEDLQVDRPNGPPRNAEIDADKPTGSINLWVVYGLILLGFVAAIGIAILIVMPFYQRR